MYERELIRTVRFTPYRKGQGPRYTLRLYDLNRTRPDGKYALGYKLTEHNRVSHVVFEGEDFGCSPLHAIDSNETVRGIMGFLTLRLGDTDREYFIGYTPAQIEFRDQHAEALDAEVYSRFGES